MILGQQNRRRIPLARERQRFTCTSVLSDAISLLIEYLWCDHSCAIRRSRLRQHNILYFRNHVHRLHTSSRLLVYVLFLFCCSSTCCSSSFGHFSALQFAALFYSSDYFTQGGMYNHSHAGTSQSFRQWTGSSMKHVQFYLRVYVAH